MLVGEITFYFLFSAFYFLLSTFYFSTFFTMKPKRILFVCLGNICRSPMAEGVFSQIIQARGMQRAFEVDSAGISGYHAGELPDTRMRRHAERRGYTLTHRSRPVRLEDFDYFDYIIGMDDQNIHKLSRLAQTKEQFDKIHRMTEFCQLMYDTEVPDPYYGGDAGFEHVIDLLEDSCEGLYRFLTERI